MRLGPWRLDKSIPLFEVLLPIQERKLGRGHPQTLSMAAYLGVNYKDAGRLALEKPGQTLNATALVHEACLNLGGGVAIPAVSLLVVDHRSRVFLNSHNRFGRLRGLLGVVS